MKGEPVFTKEEIDSVYPPLRQFFESGVTREVVVVAKDLIQDMSKAGKPYTRVEWKLKDIHTGEETLVRYDFSLTNAFQDHKDKMRFETSTFKITPTKVGERGRYDVYEYVVEYTGEGGVDKGIGDTVAPF